jgi:hypothetical protein
MQKIYTILGAEIGTHRNGKKAIVVKKLYDPKAAGASFRKHLARRLGHLGFTSSRGNADVLFQPAQKKNGEEYYK